MLGLKLGAPGHYINFCVNVSLGLYKLSVSLSLTRHHWFPIPFIDETASLKTANKISMSLMEIWVVTHSQFEYHVNESHPQTI